jgi:hypothetical protein
MNTKQRIVQNWITTVFGTVCMFTAFGMFVAHTLPMCNVDFPLSTMMMLALFGWIFLMAKDSLIEGIFMGIFKVKEKV